MIGAAVGTQFPKGERRFDQVHLGVRPRPRSVHSVPQKKTCRLGGPKPHRGPRLTAAGFDLITQPAQQDSWISFSQQLCAVRNLPEFRFHVEP